MSTIAEKTGGTFYVSTDLAAQWQGVDLDEQKNRSAYCLRPTSIKYFRI